MACKTAKTKCCLDGVPWDPQSGRKCDRCARLGVRCTAGQDKRKAFSSSSSDAPCRARGHSSMGSLVHNLGTDSDASEAGDGPAAAHHHQTGPSAAQPSPPSPPSPPPSPPSLGVAPPQLSKTATTAASLSEWDAKQKAEMNKLGLKRIEATAGELERLHDPKCRSRALQMKRRRLHTNSQRISTHKQSVAAAAEAAEAAEAAAAALCNLASPPGPSHAGSPLSNIVDAYQGCLSADEEAAFRSMLERHPSRGPTEHPPHDVSLTCSKGEWALREGRPRVPSVRHGMALSETSHRRRSAWRTERQRGARRRAKEQRQQAEDGYEGETEGCDVVEAVPPEAGAEADRGGPGVAGEADAAAGGELGGTAADEDGLAIDGRLAPIEQNRLRLGGTADEDGLAIDETLAPIEQKRLRHIYVNIQELERLGLNPVHERSMLEASGALRPQPEAARPQPEAEAPSSDSAQAPAPRLVLLPCASQPCITRSQQPAFAPPPPTMQEAIDDPRRAAGFRISLECKVEQRRGSAQSWTYYGVITAVERQVGMVDSAIASYVSVSFDARRPRREGGGGGPLEALRVCERHVRFDLAELEPLIAFEPAQLPRGKDAWLDGRLLASGVFCPHCTSQSRSTFLGYGEAAGGCRRCGEAPPDEHGNREWLPSEGLPQTRGRRAANSLSEATLAATGLGFASEGTEDEEEAAEAEAATGSSEARGAARAPLLPPPASRAAAQAIGVEDVGLRLVQLGRQRLGGRGWPAPSAATARGRRSAREGFADEAPQGCGKVSTLQGLRGPAVLAGRGDGAEAGGAARHC